MFNKLEWEVTRIYVSKDNNLPLKQKNFNYFNEHMFVAPVELLNKKIRKVEKYSKQFIKADMQTFYKH